MQVYYPPLILSAIFFGSVIVSIHDRLYGNALIEGLLAVPCVLFLYYLSQKNLDIIAYLLILLPIVLLFIGYTLGLPPKNKTPIIDISGSVASTKPTVALMPPVTDISGNVTSTKPTVTTTPASPPAAASPLAPTTNTLPLIQKS